ncbi:hypothetical protein UFOVP62_20 [uncultured Caudovirales phage]|uniref:Uncharacterized protein n=1 Tax=uncultured Caudovirales phage TaxID=2100421 RepID=A0A6J5KQJ7_9CAUD|nr:hypothetical protein UFOVP62_20 [uncultured Caudovirales phage]
MDPISLLLAAQTSYAALKGAIAAGKELQGMAKDLGSLFDSVAHITRIAAEPPRVSIFAGKSAEQIAMETYAAKAEADQMMAELKNHFVGEFGLAAWDEVVAHTTKIKKDIKAAEVEAANRQRQMLDEAAFWFTLTVFVLLGLTMIFLGFLLLRH